MARGRGQQGGRVAADEFNRRHEKQIEIERTQAELVASRAAEGAAKATITELEVGRVVAEKALAERDKTINNINRQHAIERRRWKEATRHDPETRSWADTPLPDTVRGMLQQ